MDYLLKYTDYFSENRLNIKNNHNGHQNLGCVIFNKNRIYAFGINQYNIDYKCKSLHAEVDALLYLKNQEKKCKIDIVVFRINNSHKYCNAKPCIHCIQNIRRTLKRKNYKLHGNRCWYTNENGILEYIKI